MCFCLEPDKESLRRFPVYLLSSQSLQGRLSQNLELSSFKTENKSRVKGQVPILIDEANLILKSYCCGIIWCEQQCRGQNKKKIFEL